MRINQTIGISLPPEMIEAIDNHVENQDTDRSKYIRSLIRKDLIKSRKQNKPQEETASSLNN